MAVDPISATLIATIKAAKVFAASKAKGALIKSAVKKTVKSKAKSIAKDKLLGRGKKKKKGTQPEGEGQEQQQEEETGGALVKAGSSSIIPTGLATSTAAIAKSSGGGDAGPVPDTLEGIVTKIKVTTISVEKLLGSQAALIKQRQKDKHIADEKADDKAQEKALEKSKIKGGKGPKLLKKVPGKGLFGQIFGFLTNVLFGWLLIKLIPLLPMLTSWLPKLGEFVEGYLNFIGWFYDVAITALAAIIDVGNSLVETMKGWVTSIFGEEGAKKFETFMNSLRDLINGFLVWKIIGEKIFKAVVGAITRTWKIVKGAIVKAWKIAKIGIEAAWKAAKNVGGWVGKNLMKIPGVSQVVGKVGSLASTAVKGVGTLVSKGAGVVSGWASQLFGKAAGVVAPALKAAAPAVKGFASRIPILGPIIVAVVSIMSGESLGQALFKGIGAALGGALGATLAAALTTATVGLGSLVAPAMTMLGELIGTFVGDLLYEGFMGDGWGAALDKLKGAVGGIFKAALNVGGAVINFFKDGFGRLIENFPTVNIPDFRPGDIIANILMKMPGGLDILGLEVPKWVPGIGGLSVIGGLQGLPGLQEILGFFAQFIPGMGKYIQGGRLLAIPNLLYLTPGPGLALLAPTIAKSFMPGTFGEPTAPSIPSEAPAAPKKVSAASIRAESEKRKKEAAEKALAAMKEKIGGAVDWVKGGLSKLNPFGGKDKDKETEKEPKTSMLTGGMVGKNLAANLHKGEIVIDPDSAGPARDMLLAINQASTYEGIVEAIRAFAPYEALETPPTPTSTPGSISTPSEGGSSELVIVGGGAKGEDPFEALDFFG